MKKLFVFGLMAAVLPAFAEEAADRKTATSLKYVTHELDTRQDKFTAEQNKAMEYTNSAGDVEKRAVTSNLGTSTTDTSLPMVGGVNTKLNQKQDDIAPINDHTAVTYTGTAGTIGAKGIYQDTGTYADQSDNLIDAKTFNAALKKGLDSEFLCSEYKPGTDLCWVWSIHNTETSANLFDVSTSRIAQVGTLQADGGYLVPNARTIGIWTPVNKVVFNGKANTQYTLRAKIKTDGDSSANITLGWYYSDGSISQGQPRGRYQSYTEVTAVSTAGKTVVGFGAYYNQGENIYLKDVQIELGTIATPYQPYMEPTPYTTLVPSGYTPVEYLQSDGHQYIDTEINSGPEIELRYKFRMTAQPSSGFSTALSARVSAESNSISQGLSGTAFYYGFGNNSEANRNIANITTDYTVVQNKTQMVINGTAYDYKGGYNTNFTTTGHLYMFARNNIGSSVGNFLTGRIYYAQIYNNGTLVRNFIPAKQGTTVGMYDTVSGEFFENVGEGDFTAGPDVNNIIYVPQNQ